MSPVAWIPHTRSGFPDQPPYAWSHYENAPWTPFTKELRGANIALLSSGGLYVDGDTPFNPDRNDLTFRVIPRDIDVRSLRISHNNYDTTDAERDPNCVFPLERFRDLEADGIIGSLAADAYTFMGRIFKRTALVEEMAPAMLERLRSQGADAAFLVPA